MNNSVEMILRSFHDMTQERLVIARSVEKTPPCHLCTCRHGDDEVRKAAWSRVLAFFVDVFRQFALNC